MALNGSKKSVIDHRRQLVARLRLRGLTQREIVEALPKQTLNGATGLPWSCGTIHYDIKAIEAAWRELAQIDTAQHKANVLAELEEVKRHAWAKADINTVLKALLQERSLFGLDEAKALKVEWREEARAAGIEDPDAIVEQLAAQYTAELLGEHIPGGNGDSAEAHSKDPA